MQSTLRKHRSPLTTCRPRHHQSVQNGQRHHTKTSRGRQWKWTASARNLDIFYHLVCLPLVRHDGIWMWSHRKLSCGHQHAFPSFHQAVAVQLSTWVVHGSCRSRKSGTITITTDTPCTDYRFSASQMQFFKLYQVRPACVWDLSYSFKRILMKQESFFSLDFYLSFNNRF